MKFAARESVDVYFKAKSNFTLGARVMRAGEPVLIFDTLKASSFDVAASTSYSTGGKGASRLLAFEGDKTVNFQFEDALLSNEGLAILSGADLIPARNSNLPGSSANAQSIISHQTEKIAIVTGNRADLDTNNVSGADAALGDKPPMGGLLNVWLTSKPYVGNNSSIYIWLTDTAGDPSGVPVQVNLNTTAFTSENGKNENDISYLATFNRTDKSTFVALDASGLPMSLSAYPDPTTNAAQNIFDDIVKYYLDGDNAIENWNSSWGDASDYLRTIGAGGTSTGGGRSIVENGLYGYLVAPSGGCGEPRAFIENGSYVYKVNVPSILYQDIVLADYYVEHRHDATQIDILPDKFAPYMYVEGTSLVKRASDGVDLELQFVIPKLKITTALTFSMSGTGDPSTFTFQGDAFPDYSKFDMTKKVLATMQIIGADDNYDSDAEAITDPTSYRRYAYNEDNGGYIWKDPSIEAHNNIDISDIDDYVATHGGPATITPGIGLIDTNPSDGATLGDSTSDSTGGSTGDSTGGSTGGSTGDVESVPEI